MVSEVESIERPKNAIKIINKMPTFEYLEGFVIRALDHIRTENLAVGSFCGAIIEFLGRVLLYPEGAGSEKCFKAFVENFLKDQDAKYAVVGNILWNNFRNGGAHCILPKSALNLAKICQSFLNKTETARSASWGFEPLNAVYRM